MSELSRMRGSEGYGACSDDARRGLPAGRLKEVWGLAPPSNSTAFQSKNLRGDKKAKILTQKCVKTLDRYA